MAGEPGKQQHKPSIKCHYCKVIGHLSRDCFKKKKKKAQSGVKPPVSSSMNGQNSLAFVTLQLGNELERFCVDTGAKDGVLPASRFVPDFKDETRLILADNGEIISPGKARFALKTLDGHYAGRST